MPDATVLIIDDEASICWGLSNLCSNLSFESVSTSNAERGLELAKQKNFDLVVMDVRLPGIDGISAIRHFKKINANLPVITITAFGELETAINAIQNGAFEYIVKPFDLQKVRTTIRQAVATKQLTESLEATNRVSEVQATAVEPFPRLIGSSPLMQEVFKQIALTTTSAAPVLITGERGTGKELTARSIHQFGPQRAGPFISVNVSAISTNNIEEILLGSARQTGAVQSAEGGTLFIDDVADLSLELQLKLLGVLESVENASTAQQQPIAFRLITATHQDLLSQINHGDFRHDLFYSLRTFEIKMPPLRSRKEDIPELVRYTLDRLGKSEMTVTQDFIDRLQSMTWTSNVRQLRSIVESAVSQSRSDVISSEYIVAEQAGTPENGLQVNENYELKRLIAEWTQVHWNDDPNIPLYEALIAIVDSAILPQAFALSENQYSAAARRLGIHRTTLKKKLEANEGGTEG